MTASTFYIYGPEANSTKSYVVATLTGVSFDGRVQLQDDNLVMTESEYNNAADSLKKSMDDIGRRTDGVSYSNDVDFRVNESKKQLFRAQSKARGNYT